MILFEQMFQMGGSTSRVRCVFVTQMVQLFLDHNASVESANFYGRTPLIEAVLNNHAEVVKHLSPKWIFTQF